MTSAKIRLYYSSIIKVHQEIQHSSNYMYLALARQHLGYATQVWSSQSIELMKSLLERVQRRATKYILMLPFKTEWSYQGRLNYSSFTVMITFSLI